MALNAKKTSGNLKQQPDLPGTVAPPAAAAAAKKRPPRRIVMVAIIRDESGSMRPYRTRQGEFIPQLCAGLIEAGGQKVAQLVYGLYVAVSGGVSSNEEFLPLPDAKDPVYQPDGETPIGAALSLVAEKVEAFLNGVVFPAETTVKALEVVVVSDLKATGESAEETESGVTKFLETAKKYRANVTVIGPDPEAMNHELAERLDVGEKGVRYLDSADPAAVIQVAFDSIVAASRKLGGSSPLTRNR